MFYYFSDQRLLHLQAKRAAVGSIAGAMAACSYILYFNYDKYFSK